MHLNTSPRLRRPVGLTRVRQSRELQVAETSERLFINYKTHQPTYLACDRTGSASLLMQWKRRPAMSSESQRRQPGSGCCQAGGQ